jgi:hypothetical protein
MVGYDTDPSKLYSAQQPSMLSLAKGVVDEVSTSVPMGEERRDTLHRLKAKLKQSSRINPAELAAIATTQRCGAQILGKRLHSRCAIHNNNKCNAIEFHVFAPLEALPCV